MQNAKCKSKYGRPNFFLPSTVVYQISFTHVCPKENKPGMPYSFLKLRSALFRRFKFGSWRIACLPPIEKSRLPNSFPFAPSQRPCFKAKGRIAIPSGVVGKLVGIWDRYPSVGRSRSLAAPPTRKERGKGTYGTYRLLPTLTRPRHRHRYRYIQIQSDILYHCRRAVTIPALLALVISSFFPIQLIKVTTNCLLLTRCKLTARRKQHRDP